MADILGYDLSSKAARRQIKNMVSTWVKSGLLKVVERNDRKREPKKWVEFCRSAIDAEIQPETARRSAAVYIGTAALRQMSECRGALVTPNEHYGRHYGRDRNSRLACLSGGAGA